MDYLGLRIRQKRDGYVIDAFVTYSSELRQIS